MDAHACLIRLDPSTPRSWALWPQLEDRVRVFCKEYTSDTPPDVLIQYLRKLFVETPTLLGAWVLMTEQEEMIGHLVGWVDLHWGQPYLMVYQIRVDTGYTGVAVKDEMLGALDDWTWTLNSLYESAGSPLRITMMRWMTERPEAWMRYFQKTPQRLLTVLSIPVGIKPEELHGR